MRLFHRQPLATAELLPRLERGGGFKGVGKYRARMAAARFDFTAKHTGYLPAFQLGGLCKPAANLRRTRLPEQRNAAHRRNSFPQHRALAHERIEPCGKRSRVGQGPEQGSDTLELALGGRGVK